MDQFIQKCNDWAAKGTPFLFLIDIECKNQLTMKIEDADDWDVGFQFGVLFELSEDTRFGSIYFSGVEPDFSGDAMIKPVNQDPAVSL